MATASPEYIDGYKKAIAAAIKQLEGTASDYDEMAGRIALPARDHYTYKWKIAERIKYTESAQLLRGQAKHIKDL